MRDLSWRGYNDDAFYPQVLAFISPALQSLHICSENDDPASVPRWLMVQGLAGRPDLKLEGHDGLPSATASLLKAQKRLKIVALQEFRLPGPIALALQTLQDLRELDASVRPSSSHDLEVFFANLSTGCPSLGSLHLLIHPTEAEPRLSFKSIKPLLQARMLSNLSFTPFFDLSTPLQEADIAAMGKAWPYMESLSISGTIAIQLLTAHAFHLPKLTSLKTKLTFDVDPVFDAFTPTFHSLRNLCVSGEPPEGMLLRIGAYLSWVCPPGVLESSGSKHWNSIEKIVEMGHQLQEAAVTRMKDRQ